VVAAIVCAAVLLALAIPYYAIYRIKPTSFKLTAKVAKVVAIEVEVEADRRLPRDASAEDGAASDDRPTATPEG